MNFKTLLHKLKSNQLIKDSLWSLSGNVVGRGLSLLAAIFVARFLGKDIFGEYSLIKSTILTIGVFSTFGLGYTATKFVADFKRESPEYIKLFINYATKITLIFSGVMAVLLLIFAPYVATKIFEAVSLTTPLRILAVLIVFNAITTTQIGVLSGLGAFKILAKINGTIGVLTFLVSVILTYFWKFQGALMALLIVQILNCFINYLAVKKHTTKDYESEKKDLTLQKEILTFSLPIALQEAVYSLTSWTGSVLLVRFASFGELGMYNAAMQWNAIILFIPGIMRNVVLSYLSSSSNNIVRHKKILNQTILINFVATIIPCTIVAALSHWIASVYGNTFEGLEILIILAISSAIFSSISNVYAQAFTSIGRNWSMFLLRLIRDIGVILGFIMLIKIFDVKGMTSMLLSKLILSIIFVVFVFVVHRRYVQQNEESISV